MSAHNKRLQQYKESLLQLIEAEGDPATLKKILDLANNLRQLNTAAAQKRAAPADNALETIAHIKALAIRLSPRGFKAALEEMPDDVLLEAIKKWIKPKRTRLKVRKKIIQKVIELCKDLSTTAVQPEHGAVFRDYDFDA